jgi:hypothetical protein
MKVFACCYGFRDELCVVYAVDKDAAIRKVKERLSILGMSDWTIGDLEICVSEDTSDQITVPECG